MMSSVSQAYLSHSINNVLVRCVTCLWTKGNNFQHLL